MPTSAGRDVCTIKKMTGNVMIISLHSLYLYSSPPFRAILSFSRCAHWLSCCAHGGFFVRLGVEEWERWATWVGDICGAVASSLLRQSRDVAEALSDMFLVAPCALSEGRAHSLGLLLYSQHCHHSLIRARCGWLLLRFYHWQ